jgi:hypothetical protein
MAGAVSFSAGCCWAALRGRKHGTQRCYNEGCRCEDCKQASRDYWQEYRARKARWRADAFEASRHAVRLGAGLAEKDTWQGK